jgi:acetate kinase
MNQLLVLNAGSSTLKYDVFAPWPGSGDPLRVAHGVVDRVGEAAVPDHEAALHEALEALRDGPGLDSLTAVAHRVVHGGVLTDPVLLDDSTERAIDDACVLAPLHNPAALSGIRAVRALWPDLPQFAVFDTAFHRTLSPVAATYALPPDLAHQHQIRRWGFHGISHEYVTRLTATALDVPLAEIQLVVCHIGNGVSVTAVRDGQSVDTSMGFTPMEGAVMGTRSGSIDPGVVFHLARQTELSLDEIEDLLQHRSGMLGLCGDSDVRRVRERADGGDAEARFALDVYAHRLRGLVASYVGQLPGLHAVAFTAGVGEHDPALREEVIGPLRHLGLVLDARANVEAVGPDRPVSIGTGDGAAIVVVPTDEGAEVARQARSALGSPVAQ